jgi:hypothetical protein
VVTATLDSVFPVVLRDRVSKDNSLVIASTGPLSKARMLKTSTTLAPSLQALAHKVTGRIGPRLRGGAVYTDDRAPVEWLTDLSLVQYATGKR